VRAVGNADVVRGCHGRELEAHARQQFARSQHGLVDTTTDDNGSGSFVTWRRARQAWLNPALVRGGRARSGILVARVQRDLAAEFGVESAAATRVVLDQLFAAPSDIE
jgi:hypothetical protein